MVSEGHRSADDQYWTIRVPGSSHLTVKGSRFIGHATSAESEEAAEAFIGEIIRTHHDATHNCTAYCVGRGDTTIQRYRDDGEPSGTAGKPILEEILHRGLHDVTCVVTRYFGGVKLGTGRLMRAYRQCAADTLDEAVKEVRFETISYRILYAYDHTGIVMNIVDRYGGKIKNTVYQTTKPEVVVEIRRSRADAFRDDIIEKTAGGAKIQREEVKDH